MKDFEKNAQVMAALGKSIEKKLKELFKEMKAGNLLEAGRMMMDVGLDLQNYAAMGSILEDSVADTISQLELGLTAEEEHHG